MITRIEIDGYKSFKDFSLDLFPFVVIAGSNAVGKSNLFDALRSLSRFATQGPQESFETERGSLSDLFTIYPDGSSQNKIAYSVEMLLPASVTDDFSETVTLEYRRLRYELSLTRSDEGGLRVIHERLVPIRRDEDTFLNLKKYSYVKDDLPQPTTERKLFIDTYKQNAVLLYDGEGAGMKRAFDLSRANRSVLSSITTVEFPHAYAVKRALEDIHFFQLNPGELKRPSDIKRSSSHLKADGKNLAAMLARLKEYDEDILKMISNDLAAMIPSVYEVYLEEEKEEYVIKIKHVDGYLIRSQLLSDGTLRTLALVAISYDPTLSGTILLEEPENGIHPRRTADIVPLLRSTTCSEDSAFGMTQIIINTHSVHVMDAAHNEELVFATSKKVSNSKHGSYMATEMSYVVSESPSLGNLVARNEAKRLLLETRSIGTL